MLEFQEDIIDKFQKLIYGQSSLWFSDSRLPNLKTQLSKRAYERNLKSSEEYLDFLKINMDEMNILIDRITTKQTHFFRLPEQFELLKTKILPDIENGLSEKTREVMSSSTNTKDWKVPVNIWSAGCATGEETYSLAMTIMDSFEYPRAWDINILGTDISQKALMSARQGIYDIETIKNIPNKFINKYAIPAKGKLVIVNDLIKLIKFQAYNLHQLNYENYMPINKSGPPKNICLTSMFDIIFCRNVMIYFDLPAQKKLINNLYKCLKPGGYLFTGDAECLNIHKHDFIPTKINGTYTYQKPLTALSKQQ